LSLLGFFVSCGSQNPARP